MKMKPIEQGHFTLFQPSSGVKIRFISPEHMINQEKSYLLMGKWICRWYL